MIQLARQFREHPEVRYGLTTMCIGLGHGRLGDLGEPAPRRRRSEGDEQVSTDADLPPLRPEDELQALLDEASALTPDEVVTRALSRDVALPHTGRTAVLITLDNGADHTRPTTFGPRGLAAWNARARRRAGPRRRRRPSRSPASRSSWPSAPTSGPGRTDRARPGGHDRPDRSRGVRQAAHARRSRPSRSSTARRSAAAWRSACTAHYRTVSSAAAGMALPECFLGLLPGLGRRLPAAEPDRPDNAVAVIIENAAEPEPDAERAAGRRARHRRRPRSTAPTSWSDSLDWAGRVVAGEVDRQPSGDRPRRGAGTPPSARAGSSPTRRPPARRRRRTGRSS